MLNAEPKLSIGIEEEYLLVDPETRDLVSDPPAALLEACDRRLKGRITPEFMRCQIEVGTPVCGNIREAQDQLRHLRGSLDREARAHGLRIIAASTHPFGTWLPQVTTPRDRYTQLAQDIGVPVRRLLICAMHVHAGIEDPDLRIDLMNQIRYMLPHLLCLSTSSPFWQGQTAGLKSYRLAVFNELPRTGIPEPFGNFGDYERHLRILVDAGAIEDGSKIWWDIRPSARFPTLEMRVCDVCTRLDDGITVAALYLCLLRMLWRLKRMNTTWRRYNTLLINENRWRAMRYGFDSGLIDFGLGEVKPYGELLAEIRELVAEDAEALGCQAEIAAAQEIVTRGTSAHRQLALHQEAIDGGATQDEALKAVVDWLIEETMMGV